MDMECLSIVPFGFGFGFGFLVLLLAFFLLFVAFRFLFWGPRWGWGHHTWTLGQALGEGGAPPMFEEWHKRAHGEAA